MFWPRILPLQRFVGYLDPMNQILQAKGPEERERELYCAGGHATKCRQGRVGVYPTLAERTSSNTIGEHSAVHHRSTPVGEHSAVHHHSTRGEAGQHKCRIRRVCRYRSFPDFPYSNAPSLIGLQGPEGRGRRRLHHPGGVSFCCAAQRMSLSRRAE